MMDSIVSKTRVCIKNLPPRTTERDLKEFLLSEQKRQTKAGDSTLQITDCKILKNAKGKSRKVAFVGFRLPEQATLVIDKFHRTYMNMSRITVEAATARKDENKQNNQNNDHVKADVSKAIEQENQSDKVSDDQKRKDKGVQEFLSLMGAGNSSSKFWSNDTVAGEESKDMNAVKNESDCTAVSESDSASCSTMESTNDDDGANSTKISDMDFLRSKQKDVNDLDDVETEDNSESDSSSSSSSSRSSVDESNNVKRDRTTIVEKGDEDDEHDTNNFVTEATKNRLFVRNLAFATTEEELAEHFSRFGKLTECHIPVDDQKRNKGYAFVTFESSSGAQEATRNLDKIDFQGRLLHILEARPPPQSFVAENHDKNLTWKQKQELARKQKETNGGIGESSTGWSASYVRGDAVVDNLADRLGLRKGDILGVKDKLSSGDAAVRMALGETQIIEENREYFRQHGVDMEALVSANEESREQQQESESTKKRSKTAILVKNLPFDTRVDELEKLFHVGQEPVNILLPPSRTIAMIVYGHSTDAKRAFRKLAYRRFKHVPIYLEWAPMQAMKAETSSKDPRLVSDTLNKSSMERGKNNGSIENEIRNDLEDIGGNDGESATLSSTLYVKNLNFETTEENLKRMFEKQIGQNVLSVRIPRKVAPAKSGSKSAENRSQSMGYGFVELSSHDVAKKAMVMLQGKLLDGYSIQLATSSQKGPSQAKIVSSEGKKAPTKIMVRNVPFQATRKEILKLFGMFGQLKKVRLPKKFDGSHRGFAFVEYLAAKEASAAMAALSRTHLYGRHLVLEWASVEEENDSSKNIERLREKAKRDATQAARSSGEMKRKNKKIRFE